MPGSSLQREKSTRHTLHDEETTMDQQWIVQPGTDVYGADDRKIGTVDDIQDGYLVIHKGFFFPKDHYIPFSAINNHTEDRINLNVTADEATNRDWDQVPAGSTTTTSTVAYTTDTAPLSTPTTGYDTTTTTTGYDTTATTGTTRVANDTDRISVPVIEEELTATKRGVERGAVRIETNVTEREETLSVPVTEERVHVERVAVNRDATAADLDMESRTIEVPLYGEEVEMSKRARVVEEVEISKDAVQETRQVSGTVRREDVNVQDVNVVDSTTTTGTTTTDATVTDPSRRRQ
jgi:uncharacterized protein (TIGR02271 family)